MNPEQSFKSFSTKQQNANPSLGLKQTVREVSTKEFPQPENWIKIKDQVYKELPELLKE